MKQASCFAINQYMRFFIALEIPDENKFELQEIQRKLKEILPDIRLSELNKLHLTLAFVGEQSPDLLGPLTTVLEDAARGEEPFEVTPSYIDGFPHFHRAKVLWVGVKGDIDKLMVIRHKIKDGLIRLKQDVDERRFIPHIALGKVNNVKITKEQEEALQAFMEKDFSPIRVSSLKLFESVANQGFHHHNTLTKIPLV